MPLKYSVRERDLGSTVAEAQQRIADKVSLPQGYKLDWAGEFGALVEAQKRLAVIVPLSLLLIFMLPWAVPALPSYLSINWMLNGQWGLINNIIWNVAQVDGPPWLDSHGFALASVIYGHNWKWLPFWTLIFLA